VTLKLKHGLPRLRGRKPFNAIAGAFRKYAEGNGFRLVHFSVQHDHLHLMVEADGKAMLSRGMQKLVISISRRLNLLWGEGKRWLGRLFRERYHPCAQDPKRSTARLGVRHAQCGQTQRDRAWRLRSLQLRRALRRLREPTADERSAAYESIDARQSGKLDAYDGMEKTRTNSAE
jgi:REP element-mobilizing transposase RayT